MKTMDIRRRHIKQIYQECHAAHSCVAGFREDVDRVAEVADLDEHDFVAVVVPVIRQIDRRIVRRLAVEECRLVHHDNSVSRWLRDCCRS